MKEQWRPLVGYEGVYSVSDRGRIRRELNEDNTWAGRVMTPHPSEFGHLTVALCKEGVESRVLVHRAVLFAFVGPPGPGQQCRHLNGKSGDNRLENLCWGTAQEDRDDMKRHGTRLTRKNHHPKTKISPKGVQRVLKLRRAGLSQQKIADRFYVGQTCIQKILAKQEESIR